ERPGHLLPALPARHRIPERDTDRELPADLHLRGRPRDRRGCRPPRLGRGRILLGNPPVREPDRLAARNDQQPPTATVALRDVDGPREPARGASIRAACGIRPATYPVPRVPCGFHRLRRLSPVLPDGRLE